MTAEGSDAFSVEKKQSPQAVEIDSFMQRIYQSHGPQSMIYVSDSSHYDSDETDLGSPQISFGSIFWSAEPEKIWTFVEVIMEKKLPFVSISTPLTKMTLMSSRRRS